MKAEILGFRIEGGLGVVQFATPDQDTLQYISSEKAINGRLMEVREVSEAGRVNTLVVLNHSDSFVFLLDGDILVGAKQNRVVNTSMLLAPASRTEIPVSCVEQGRWRSVSPHLREAPYVAPCTLRAEKTARITMNLEQRRGYLADQERVWDGVALFQLAAGVESKTENLGDVFEEKRNELDAALSAHEPLPGANVLVVTAGCRMVSLDVFNRRDIYAEYFPRILRGMALEALCLGAGEPPPAAEGESRALDLLARVEALPRKTFPGAGVGTEGRFGAQGLAGSELVYEGRLVHLMAVEGGSGKEAS
ncbi:MAG: DUF6569 family protein [Bacteroidota bacterium]